MKQKKIPLRKCTGCNEMKPKKELIRIVRSPEVKNENGEVITPPEISLDTTGKNQAEVHMSAIILSACKRHRKHAD